MTEPTNTGEPVAASPNKVDPETLVLRARPARAIRFKRGVIVSLVAVAAAGIAGTAWIALKPASFHMVSDGADQTKLATAPTDTLSALPSTYGDVPKLGPPLPGDLGKPILERQAQLAAQTGTSAGAPAQNAAAYARQQRLDELRAARHSGLLFQGANGVSGGAVPPSGPVAAPGTTQLASSAPAKLALDSDRDQNAQQHKADFVSALDKDSPVNPHSVAAPASPYRLSAGSVIAASLITGLRSDLPGFVTAQVTEQVYDSATGLILLIPQGARLIGKYDSVVAFGQRRALVVWQRIIWPDGRSVQIDNMPATDASGYAGLEGKVDFHTWSLLKGVVISTALGVGAELQFSGEGDLVQALRESAQQNVSRAGDQLTMRNLQVQPTITIRPGAPVLLMVNRDLVLAPGGAINA
jgi:type IV secretion system protein TrbI